MCIFTTKIYSLLSYSSKFFICMMHQALCNAALIFETNNFHDYIMLFPSTFKNDDNFPGLSKVLKVPLMLWHWWMGIQHEHIWVMRCWRGYSVWSEVQMIRVLSSWCHFHPSFLASLKSGTVYISGPGLPGLSRKEAVNRVCLSSRPWNLREKFQDF